MVSSSVLVLGDDGRSGPWWAVRRLAYTSSGMHIGPPPFEGLRPPSLPSCGLSFGVRTEDSRSRQGEERRCAGKSFAGRRRRRDRGRAPVRLFSVLLPRPRTRACTERRLPHRQRRSSCKGAGTYLSVTSVLNSVESTASPAPPHPPPSNSVAQVGSDNEVTLIPSLLPLLDLRFLDPYDSFVNLLDSSVTPK